MAVRKPTVLIAGDPGRRQPHTPGLSLPRPSDVDQIALARQLYAAETQGRSPGQVVPGATTAMVLALVRLVDAMALGIDARDELMQELIWGGSQTAARGPRS